MTAFANRVLSVFGLTLAQYVPFDDRFVDGVRYVVPTGRPRWRIARLTR
ncbi:hypothetical protein [Sphingomonas sp. Leaf10]|nr:hypothetical protein [Sphingomonas sp. Leaf10]